MRKTKSAIMGTMYNPFMVRYFLENFKRWQDKIDVLYICLDRFHCKEVEGYLEKEIEKFPKIKIRKGLVGYPENTKTTILETKEDLIFTLHDDIYIYQPEIIDEYFQVASEGKIVMPVQNIFDLKSEVKEAIDKKYPVMPWRIGDDSSYTYLMYFTFCSRENYLKTDINLNGNTYDSGYIKELDHTFDHVWGGELGFWQGLQFLYNNVNFIPIKANHLAFVPHQQEPLNIFAKMIDDGLGWLHLQNMARTITLWFPTEEEWYVGNFDKTQHKIHSLESLKDNSGVLEDMALKIAWLEEYLAVDTYEGIKSFYDYVKEELRYIIDYMGIDKSKITAYKEIINKLK